MLSRCWPIFYSILRISAVLRLLIFFYFINSVFVFPSSKRLIIGLTQEPHLKINRMPFSRISLAPFGLAIISQLFFIKFKKLNFKLRANVNQTRAGSSMYSTWDQIDDRLLLTSQKWTATMHSQRLWMWHRPDCACPRWYMRTSPAARKPENEMEYRAGRQLTHKVIFGFQLKIVYSLWTGLHCALYCGPYRIHLWMWCVSSNRKKPEDSLQPLLFAGFPSI